MRTTLFLIISIILLSTINCNLRKTESNNKDIKSEVTEFLQDKSLSYLIALANRIEYLVFPTSRGDDMHIFIGEHTRDELAELIADSCNKFEEINSVDKLISQFIKNDPEGILSTEKNYIQNLLNQQTESFVKELTNKVKFYTKDNSETGSLDKESLINYILSKDKKCHLSSNSFKITSNSCFSKSRVRLVEICKISETPKNFGVSSSIIQERGEIATSQSVKL